MSSLKPLPVTQNPLVLRADFSDPLAWQAIVKEIQRPVGLFRFRANVEFLDDPAYAGLTADQVPALLPKDYPHPFLLLADEVALRAAGYPLLVVDLDEMKGRAFRALARQVQAIENNLSIANMDFDEFAAAVDQDGVFRGFPKS